MLGMLYLGLTGFERILFLKSLDLENWMNNMKVYVQILS